MSNIPRCEHPRPDRLRQDWLNLNGVWDFEIDNAKVGLEKKFYERDSLDGKITVPFSPESVLSGIGHTDFMNAVWYRRNIEIPTAWAGKRVILHIDACDHTTRVFVNGKSVGKIPLIYGQTVETEEIKEFCLKFYDGDESEEVICLKMQKTIVQYT